MLNILRYLEKVTKLLIGFVISFSCCRIIERYFVSYRLVQNINSIGEQSSEGGNVSKLLATDLILVPNRDPRHNFHEQSTISTVKNRLESF